MANLNVPVTFNYSASTLINVTSITYTNLAGTVTAIFQASQFDNVQIKNFVGINGSVGVNRLQVTGADIKGNMWIFSNWAIIDRVVLTGTSGADVVRGTSQDDLISGGNGNDSLSGSQGDSIYGGDGDDRLSSAGNSVINGGTGIDLFVFSSPLTPATFAIDILDGGGNRNIGDGTTLTGIERIDASGSSHNDSISGGNLADTIKGDFGADILVGRGGNDKLAGGPGNDNLSGGLGGDVIGGGEGTDTLIGGAGADRFMWYVDLESGLSQAADLVSDFEQGKDKLDLHRISSQTGDPKFLFIGETEFLGEDEPELRFIQNSLSTIVQADSDGDGFADFEIRLIGVFNLTLADFIL